MNYLIYLTFLLLSFGQLNRFSFFNQEVNFYLYEIVILVNLIWLFLRYRLAPIVLGGKRFLAIYFFIGVMVFSYLLNFFKFTLFENFVAGLYFLRFVVYFCYFFYLLYHLSRNPYLKKDVFRGILLFTVLTVVFSLVQYFLYPDLRNLLYLGWDPHLYRLFGLFFEPFLSAGLYGLLFFFTLFRLESVFLRYSLLVIFFIFIFLAYSRAGYLAFILSLGLYLFKKNGFKHLLLLLIFSGAIVFLLPKPFGEGVNLSRQFSIRSRLADYKNGLVIWANKPVFGYGYNRIRYVKRNLGLLKGENWRSSHSGASFHSSFLVILVTGGLIGLIGFIASVLTLAKEGFSSVIYIFYLSLFSLFDNLILHPFVLVLLLCLLLLEIRGVFNPQASS